MLEQIKKLLGISDNSQNELLQTILSLTESRLKNLLGGTDSIPQPLAYIVTEVAVRRFNRIGSEGLSSHTVEGETMAWPDDDFAPYDDDIQAYLDAQDDPSTHKGRIRFL